MPLRRGFSSHHVRNLIAVSFFPQVSLDLYYLSAEKLLATPILARTMRIQTDAVIGDGPYGFNEIMVVAKDREYY